LLTKLVLPLLSTVYGVISMLSRCSIF